MALIHIPFADIGETQLQRLIDAKASESRDIEYKRNTYGDSDGERAEWLADVSSFPNTVGGDLIIGIEAAKGVPTRLAPLTLDMDREILRLEQIAQSNLQPRIPNLQFKAIPLSGRGHALLIRAPRSYNPPHRIVRQGKGQHRFWARSSAGKYEPNVDELRALFMLAPQLTERIRDFRFDRIAKIVGGDAPVRLLDQVRLIMHLVPFSSFDPGSFISLPDAEKHPHAFPPIGSSAAQAWRINFDGILLTSNAEGIARVQRAYTQIYRSGRIEAVASSIAGGEGPEGIGPRLTSINIEGLVLLSLVKYLKSLQFFGVEPPYAVMISLTGVKSMMINVGVKAQWFDGDDIAELDRDQFHFREMILETVPRSIQECAAMIRPFIEQLANTAGRSTSSSFGLSGEYLHAFK
jgi:hypothetical protein